MNGLTSVTYAENINTLDIQTNNVSDMIYNNRTYLITITTSLALLLTLLGSTYSVAQGFAQTSNATQPFVFVYKVTGGFPAVDQRTFYDSLTKDMIFTYQGTVMHPAVAIKIIPLNDTDEYNLKKVMRDNHMFATNETYYTHKLDIPVSKLGVILDGKVHTVTMNLFNGRTPEKPVPEGLLKIIQTIQNITTSK